LIKNYGLFWKRAGVFFGERGPNSPARLFGDVTRNRETVRVNLSEQTGIYCLYDDNFSLLYAGKAGGGRNNILRRLRDHIGDDLAERWSIFSWFGLRPVVEENGRYLLGTVECAEWNESSLMASLEGVLILGAEPSLNRQGARFSETYKFRQVWDEKRDPRQSEMISEIWKSLQSK